MAQYQREMIYRKYLSLIPKIECKVIYDIKLVAIHNSNPSKFHILFKKKNRIVLFCFCGNFITTMLSNHANQFLNSSTCGEINQLK